jgi:hypothetical protein
LPFDFHLGGVYAELSEVLDVHSGQARGNLLIKTEKIYLYIPGDCPARVLRKSPNLGLLPSVDLHRRLRFHLSTFTLPFDEVYPELDEGLLLLSS